MSLRFVRCRAYEVWGSPEVLNKEKAKRAKVRQEEYEGKRILFTVRLLFICCLQRYLA